MTEPREPEAGITKPSSRRFLGGTGLMRLEARPQGQLLGAKSSNLLHTDSIHPTPGRRMWLFCLIINVKLVYTKILTNTSKL